MNSALVVVLLDVGREGRGVLSPKAKVTDVTLHTVRIGSNSAGNPWYAAFMTAQRGMAILTLWMSPKFVGYWIRRGSSYSFIQASSFFWRVFWRNRFISSNKNLSTSSFIDRLTRRRSRNLRTLNLSVGAISAYIMSRNSAGRSSI
jgi:hypothetical protein